MTYVFCFLERWKLENVCCFSESESNVNSDTGLWDSYEGGTELVSWVISMEQH